MITTIVNGIMIDAESIVEVHYVERRYNRYEDEENQELPRPRGGYRRASRLSDDDTITQIMREILATKRGQ